MNHNSEDEMPDFASAVSKFQKEDVRENKNEKTDPSVAVKIRDLMEKETESVAEELDESSEDDSISDYESEDEADSAGTASESESEVSDQDDKDSVASDTDASASEYESEEEESIASSESLQASKTISVCEQDEDTGSVCHVYENDDQKEDGSKPGDWTPSEEEEVCYEATDLGGEDVATASMLAASLLAGGGAVRSRTGWTSVNMLVVLSAAGALGLILLYTIKRINDLTRLVKILEENSHMTMNERDVQVITAQVIDDMLEDVEDTPSANEMTSQPVEEDVEEDGVQTEFKKFEQLDRAQSFADITEAKDVAFDISVSGVVPDEYSGDADKTDKVASDILGSDVDADTDDKVASDILGCDVDDPNKANPDNRNIDVVPASNEPSVAKHSPSQSVRDAEHSDKSALEVDELVDRIEIMSLSDERVTTRKSSRLASSSSS